MIKHANITCSIPHERKILSCKMCHDYFATFPLWCDCAVLVNNLHNDIFR